MITNKILKHTENKVREFFKAFPVPAHGFDHVTWVVNYAKKIAEGEDINNKLVEMCGWLHDIGRVPEYKDNPKQLTHHQLSGILASEWFKNDKIYTQLTEAEKKEILYAVVNHWNDKAEDYKSAVILRDADKLDLWGTRGLARHKEFNAGQYHNLMFSLVYNLERIDRLQTKKAHQIVKNEFLLQPLEKYLVDNKSKKGKVLVALSGGVDSAVAAEVLIKAGYEVTGGFIKCFSDKIDGNKSCWIDEWRDAMRVAAKLGIKLLKFDFEKEYKKDVVDYLYKEYKLGRTPNPDVMCNKYVKIPLLLKQAKKLGFDFIATGHYAQIKEFVGKSSNGQNKIIYQLYQALDKNKDQSYFLHQLGQKELAHILFPLGKVTKEEVRIFAKKWDLPVAQKEESMGICFIGEIPVKEFLTKKIKSKPGKILLSNGNEVGIHDGLPFYTIGQRIGINLPVELLMKGKKNNDTRPLYVVEKNLKKNILIVGFEDDKLLFKKTALLKKINWTQGVKPKLPLKCFARLRHRQELQEATVRISKGGIKIDFVKPQRAITPGQFVVFYKHGECLGGGEIK